MEINFCNESSLDDHIITLINSEITPGVPKSKIEDFYKKWKYNFDTRNEDFDIKNHFIASDFNLPIDKTLVGIDYPTWFNYSFLNEKTIMILGIDPLRDVKAFDEFAVSKELDVNTEAIIGTPYALHRKLMREGKDDKLRSYWGFIKALIDKNYGIYLTDVFKVFFISQNKRSYNHLAFTENEKHLNLILDKEIEIVKPDLIIVLGSKPFQILCKKKIRMTDRISNNHCYNGIPVLPMVHLSGLAGGGRKKFIQNNLDEQNLTDDASSYLKIVENFLEK